MITSVLLVGLTNLIRGDVWFNRAGPPSVLRGATVDREFNAVDIGAVVGG